MAITSNFLFKRKKWISCPLPARKGFYDAGGQYAVECPNWRIDDAEWKSKQTLRVFPLKLFKSFARPISMAEVGCGTGGVLAHLTEDLRRSGLGIEKIEGYDISRVAIERAKNMFPELRFWCCDFLQTNDRYDCLLIMDVVEHVEDAERFVSEISQRADYLIFHVPFEDTLSIRIRRRYNYLAEHIGHIHFFDPGSFRYLVEVCGLRVLRWGYTPYFEQSWKRNKSLKNAIPYFPRLLGKHIGTNLVAKILGQFEMIFLCKS